MQEEKTTQGKAQSSNLMQPHNHYGAFGHPLNQSLCSDMTYKSN